MFKDLPEAKYTKFGEKIRHVIPGPMQCSMACGGRNCKWENPSRWSNEDQVVKGVFSSWVLDDVVAMSRPSTEVIEKYQIIQQFKDNKICSIINLQRPGEHASCGPPLNKESQFTYDPKVFMDNDVFFYNFGWKDYGVTSLETILDMVKVMAFALSEGKVAVHCHAGLGRTGVLIACYLVYAHRMDASEAINTVRKRRPNSIQTRGQIACIQEFAQFLKPLRIVFPQVVPHAERLTLVQFLHRQRHLLHGIESRQLRYLPKVISTVCQRLTEIATTSQDMTYDARMRSNSGLKSKSKKRKRGTLRRSNTVETLKETIPGAFVNEKPENSDPMGTQEMNAILSPRFSRRKDSAKSRSSSETKSQSRPESPVTHLDISIEADITVPAGKLRVETPSRSPILVTSAPQQSLMVETDNVHDEELNNIPGKPKVVLVKQGSRPTLLSAVPNISPYYSNADANLNNNNQMAPSTSVPSMEKSESFTEEIHSLDKNAPAESSADSIVIEGKEIDMTQREVEGLFLPNLERDSGENKSLTGDLPSLTYSLHEPRVSPSSQAGSFRKGAPNAGGDKCLVQNIPKSSGRILPTGLPPPLKGLKYSLLAGDTNISVADDGDADIDVPQNSNHDDHSEKRSTSEKDSQNEPELPHLDSASVNESKEKIEEMELEDNVFDHDLEEIIEMKDDGEKFLSGSECEVEETGLNMPKSAASKVSWSENKNDMGNDIQLTIADEARQGGRRTPLMYRAEKTQELLESEKEMLDLKNEFKDSSEDKIDENEIDEVEDDLVKLSLSKPIPKHGKRPKSAGFLKRLAEKNSSTKKTLSKSLSLTQSLCDLRGFQGLSCDDLALMKTELTSDLFSPLSPSSKSSSSDDVRTPTGSASKRRIKDPITVANALAYKLTDNEWLWEKVYSKQVELNTREGAWSSIEQEVDAHLLSSLMWSWVEHLSEPILTAEDVKALIKESRPVQEFSNHATECPDPNLFEKALTSLGKPVSSTLQCILHCLSSLQQLSFELELSVIRRVTAAFTHSTLENGNIATKMEEDQKNNEQLVSLIQNYIVRTRGRNVKKYFASETRDVKDTLKKRASEPVLESKTFSSSQQIKSEYSKGEEDTVSTSSKVPELPRRIAVS